MIDFDKGLGVTPRVLDAISVRAKVVLHNIANQHTPGFKRYTVSFEERLREAGEQGGKLSDVYPVVERDDSGDPDENNVSIVEELALLDKVNLMHDVFARRAGGYFAVLNKAIRGQG